MESNKYKISEIFYSPQGEGRYTGQLTAWVRSFACNLQCSGFGQTDPTDPTSYILPYQTFDLTNIKKLEDLPVFDFGCDSSYSWSARYKHLCPTMTAEEIAVNIVNRLPNKTFWQPQANNFIHLAFTGGEPMLPKSQQMICDVIQVLRSWNEFPEKVTIETNGTQVVTSEFGFMNALHYSGYHEMFASVSPKLFNVSGETRGDAINETAIRSIARTFNKGQLKFVVNNTDAAWKEMQEVIKIYRFNGVHFPVYVMPVGATAEQQDTKHIKQIAQRAMADGYNIAARVHTYIFGNSIGT